MGKRGQNWPSLMNSGPFGGGSLNSVDRDLWTREDKTGHR